MAQVEANILLAQSSQESAEGGVSALGVGWQVRPPDPIPWSLLVVLSAPREMIGQVLPCIAFLEQVTGEPVTDAEGAPLAVSFTFEPEGFTAESGLISPVIRSFSLNLPPLPLDAGREYLFRLQIDEESRDHWVAHFRTMTESEMDDQMPHTA